MSEKLFLIITGICETYTVIALFFSWSLLSIAVAMVIPMVFLLIVVAGGKKNASVQSFSEKKTA